jgi:hypothetical protein
MLEKHQKFAAKVYIEKIHLKKNIFSLPRLANYSKNINLNSTVKPHLAMLATLTNSVVQHLA